MLYRSPRSAIRWKFGVSIGPPKGLVAPNPTSSVRISKTFGAPFGGATAEGKSGVESFTSLAILPLKDGSGFGRTVCAAELLVCGDGDGLLQAPASRQIPKRTARLNMNPPDSGIGRCASILRQVIHRKPYGFSTTAQPARCFSDPRDFGRHNR